MLTLKEMAKEPSRGVFWVIDGKLLSFPFFSGTDMIGGIAKSGNTYNHKKLWPDIKPKGCNKPYNYYPRGRVEFTARRKARIFVNPNVDENIVREVKLDFGITGPADVIYDNSEHYKCYLDAGWKPDNSR